MRASRVNHERERWGQNANAGGRSCNATFPLASDRTRVDALMQDLSPGPWMALLGHDIERTLIQILVYALSSSKTLAQLSRECTVLQ